MSSAAPLQLHPREEESSSPSYFPKSTIRYHILAPGAADDQAIKTECTAEPLERLVKTQCWASPEESLRSLYFSKVLGNPGTAGLQGPHPLGTKDAERG